VFEVESPLSMFENSPDREGKLLLQSIREVVLSIQGVQRCEIVDGQKFEVTVNGGPTLGHQVSVAIGQHLNGSTVFHGNDVTMFFHVEGMTCGSCTETVRRATSAVEGVTFSSVHLKGEMCAVVMSREACNADGVMTAIENVGFDAKPFTANKV
jgi:Cu+-exporting ATPase